MITGDETAYPTMDSNGQNMPELRTTGLTIRQQFAAMAMQGLLANLPKTHMDDALPMISQQSVRFADALINELNQPTP